MGNKQNIPKLRFPGFEGEWENSSGDSIFCSISDKNHNSDLPILAITQEYGAIPRDLIDYFITVTEKSISTYKIVEKGDFIISLRSFQGGIEYSAYKGICSPAYIVLRPKEKIDTIFFKYYFKTERYIKQLTKNLEGIRDGKMISFKYFSEAGLIFPTLSEQQKIASFFTAIDTKLSQLKKKKELLEQYKKGVMQKIFSQQLRFKDENGKEFPKWEKRKFGEIVKIKTKKYNPAKESDSVKCIELENLSSVTGQLLGYVEGSVLNSIKNKFEAGDVLFGKLRPYLRKYLKPDFDGVCSSEIWVLKGLKISNDFLYWLVQTDDFIETANKSSGSKMPRADWSLISSQYFQFPIEKEQKKIASFLTAIDKKIALVSEALEDTGQWKKGLLQRMFC
jgi:type I restriction enzyme, S subunit